MRLSWFPRILAARVSLFACAISASLSGGLASAASPESLALGRQLFEKTWTPRNPSLGSDGLGPLFNASSCAACHNQGGVGGSGAAQFNAKTISIETMQVTPGPVTKDIVAASVRRFHPGFIDPRNRVTNSLPLAHFGGTSLFDQARTQLMQEVRSRFSKTGGPISAAEVRLATATPILYSANDGKFTTTLRARMFQRNTTALFGAGLLDQVKSRELRQIEREQMQHPEISGRLATLASGGVGRFGWRGNVRSLLDFCDKACAAEVGLETKRKVQPADPTVPGYRNPSVDITDSQIRAMTAFVAALPPPQRKVPPTSEMRRLAARGEQLFASIGCAVCHRPNLGPAKGAYTDLLLHDMGPKSYDLNPADPYIRKLTPVTRVDYQFESSETSTTTLQDDVMGTYYGGTYVMTEGSSTSQTTRSSGGTRAGQSRVSARPSASYSRKGYAFSASPVPATTLRIINQGQKSRDYETQEDFDRVEERSGGTLRNLDGGDSYSVRQRGSRTTKIRETQTAYLRGHIEPTNFTQEWRTPPLWGVADSAPYMHDGRAATLLEAITMHQGEAFGTRDRFLQLSHEDRQAVIEFLGTLVAPISAPQPRS